MTDAEKTAAIIQLGKDIQTAFQAWETAWQGIMEWLRSKGLSNEDIYKLIDTIHDAWEKDQAFDNLVAKKARLERRKARQLEAAKHPVMGPPAALATPTLTSAKSRNPKAK